MGDVVSLWRLDDVRGENDLAGDSPRAGTAFSGDRIVSAWKKSYKWEKSFSLPYYYLPIWWAGWLGWRYLLYSDLWSLGDCILFPQLTDCNWKIFFFWGFDLHGFRRSLGRHDGDDPTGRHHHLPADTPTHLYVHICDLLLLAGNRSAAVLLRFVGWAICHL